MSKPDLLTNIKFRRLLKATGLPRPLLIGHLEMLWTTAHVGKPVFLDADDVELAADWDGEPGQFAAHLIKYGFLDETDDGLAIHDYWDHAPENVKRRERRRRRKEAMSTIDRPLTDTAPAKAPLANQAHTASVTVRDPSVPVREVSKRQPIATPLTDNTTPASDCSLEEALAKLDKSSPWYPHWRGMLTRVHQRLFTDSIPLRAPPSTTPAA